MSRIRSAYKTEHGLSLLEIVVAIAIIAIFTTIGIISFQHLTDNARQTAVQRTANDVFTLAMATKELPNGANTIGTMEEIAAQHNENNSDIFVEILEEDPDITVTATGWNGRYSATRSTIVDHDGIVRTPDDEGEVVTGINQYSHGIFSFTTQEETSQLVLYGLSDNATIDHESFEEPQQLTAGITTLEAPGTYTIRGGFEQIGLPYDRFEFSYELLIALAETGDMDAAIEQLGSKYTDFMEAASAIANTPFINGAEIHEWTDTGTQAAIEAFSGSNMRNMPEPPETLENMNGMFAGAQSIVFDITDWDTSNVRDMGYLFSQMPTFNQDISGWETGNVESMLMMFDGATEFNQDISSWDVSNVEKFSGMFNKATSFNQPIGKWKTSSAVYMDQMFYEASSFNQPLNNWDTSNVELMSHMFQRAYAFDQDISDWDVSSVLTMRSMFRDATIFNNGGKPLDWENTENVTDMGSMFYRADVFDQDVSMLNTSNVEKMDNMFRFATTFNNGGAPLNWDTSKVTTMHSMFYRAESFNQDISQWDVSSLQIVDWMFIGAHSFDQDLSTWDLTHMPEPSSFAGGEYKYETHKHPRWAE